jgi:hypothetical protein
LEYLTIAVTILVALITSVIGPIILEWAKSKIGKSSKSGLVDEAIDTNALVDDQLQQILEKLDCDRIWLAQFHNGGNFYPTKKSIQKFSIFYEKLSPGTTSIFRMLQNIPVSLFPQALSAVLKDRELAIDDVDGADDLFGLENITYQQNTKSLYMVGVYSLDDELIGVIGIAFNTQHSMVLDEWIYLRQKIGTIGTLLTEYLYKGKANK